MTVKQQMMKRQKEVVSDHIRYSAKAVSCYRDFTSLSHSKSDVVEQRLSLGLENWASLKYYSRAVVHPTVSNP